MCTGPVPFQSPHRKLNIEMSNRKCNTATSNPNGFLWHLECINSALRCCVACSILRRCAVASCLRGCAVPGEKACKWGYLAQLWALFLWNWFADACVYTYLLKNSIACFVSFGTIVICDMNAGVVRPTGVSHWSRQTSIRVASVCPVTACSHACQIGSLLLFYCTCNASGWIWMLCCTFWREREMGPGSSRHSVLMNHVFFGKFSPHPGYSFSGQGPQHTWHRSSSCKTTMKRQTCGLLECWPTSYWRATSPIGTTSQSAAWDSCGTPSSMKMSMWIDGILPTSCLRVQRTFWARCCAETQTNDPLHLRWVGVKHPVEFQIVCWGRENCSQLEI